MKYELKTLEHRVENVFKIRNSNQKKWKKDCFVRCGLEF